MPLFSKLAPRMVRSWARLDGRLRRAPELLGDAMAAGLARALTPQEQNAASIAIYDTTAASRIALFDWESTWYAAALPAPPATVLVTGAGGGIEVAALLKRGFIVDAAEPAPALLERLRERTQSMPLRAARCLDHQGALRTVETYDAVLFGWGSFTCVLDPVAQLALLQAAASVCTGPILLSFWMRETAGAPPAHRLARVGDALGRGVARIRGRSPIGDVRFRHWCGFGYVFTRVEIETLAAQIDRHVVWGNGQYPHAALMPVADPPPAR